MAPDAQRLGFPEELEDYLASARGSSHRCFGPGGEYADYVFARRVAAVGRELARPQRQRSRSGEIPELGIEAGTHDVQRFVYHFFMKCFWSDELDAEANAAINYDWYHPQDRTRHTLPEVLEWHRRAGLDVVHQYVDPYGITVRGRRAG